MSKRIIWCLITSASLLTFVHSEFHVSSASNPSGATLRSRSHAVRWSGTLARNAAASGAVPECVATPCDRFDLNVDLPGGVWNNKPGGLQIALRWTAAFFGDNLLLYVYKDGSLVAKSDGIISTAQSVLIPQAANGLYTIYVAFDQASVGDPISYEALAEVEYSPNPHPTRNLLPDLVVRPQRNVTFQTTDFDFFEPPPAPGESCFPSEMQEESAQTCLRFDQVYANIGEGAMELRFVVPRDHTSPSRNIFQRVYRSNGGFVERSAGEWEFHPAHDHFHYTGFGLSRLWASDATGAWLGASPVTTRRFELKGKKHRQAPPAGDPVRTGRKVSFCLADIEIDFWGMKGDAARRYNAPDCLFPAFSDAENHYLVQGIGAGWADVYDWFLPDQYIEVTGVEDGYYILETVADPDNTLLEAAETNNCGAVLIRLTAMGTTARTAEIIRPMSSCRTSGSPGP